jgi:tetratricopeptide (TPR) repeat protein
MELSDLLLQRGDAQEALALLDRAVLVSTSARTYIARAALYRVLGRLDDAELDLEMARQIEPGSVDALIALGSLRRSEGDVDRAKEAYRLVLSLAPGTAASHMGLADLAFDQGKLDEAWWQFEAAKGVEPASSAPLVSLAAARARQNDWDEAEVAYLQAAELAPAATVPYIGLADIAQRRSGSAEDALAWLDKIDGLAPAQGTVKRTMASICRNSPASAGCEPGLVAEALQEAAQLEPDRPDANLALADLYLAEGRPEEAGPFVTLAQEIAPRDPAVHVAQGNVHHALGDLEAAESSFRQAIGLDATRMDGHLALARFFVAEEKHAEAVAAYQEAIRKFPLDWSLWLSLGNVYLTMESFADALTAFQQAATMNPHAPQPWLGQGDVQMAKEKWEAAQEAYEQAQRLDPEQAEALLRLSTLAEERDKDDKALQYARQAVKIDPTLAAGHLAVGRMLQEDEKNAEAADAFLSAIKLDPRRHAAYNRWMWCYTDIKREPYDVDRSRLEAELAKIAAGDQRETLWAQTLLGLGYLTLEEDIERAIAHLEKAAEMDPTYTELYQDLALANEEGRDGPRALEWWQRYLYAAPPGTDTSEAQKHIDNLKLVSIEQPGSGDHLSGRVKITGTAKGKMVQSYKLVYRPVGSEEWLSISTGTEKITNGLLGTWDTTGLLPGEYEIRLDVIRSDEDFRPYDQITVVVGP